jgi:hypothetical protein
MFEVYGTLFDNNAAHDQARLTLFGLQRLHNLKIAFVGHRAAQFI